MNRGKEGAGKKRGEEGVKRGGEKGRRERERRG